MKRILGLFLAFLFIVSTTKPALGVSQNGDITLGVDVEGTGSYESKLVQTVRIALNGAILDSDVPAFFWGERTMVPVRLLAEKMGAEVQWLTDSNTVDITLGEYTVKLQIGSSQAQVNGETVMLYDGIPALLVNYNGIERTMVPLRFVSEHLGAQVEWIRETCTAAISTGQKFCQVTGIEADADARTVHISTSDEPNYVVTDLGEQVVVDILDAELSFGAADTITVNNELVSCVRYAQHGEDFYTGFFRVVRVVLDLKKGITFQDNIELTPLSNGLILTAFQSETEERDDTFITPINPTQKTVVLDAGHGGGQTGALYEGVSEKNINLAVAKKLEAILLDYGYNVVMTRTDDTAVGLYERADMANAAKADIFVSLHSNAAPGNAGYTGIYTYYYPGSSRGAQLAQAIQMPACEKTGAIDRGIKSANFVVLRETNMCAVLVEMGFMTNSGELQQLLTPDYQDRLAEGIAKGIVMYLNGI